MNDKNEFTKRLLDLMDAAYGLLKRLYPDANNLMIYASEDGICVNGYRVAPSRDASKIIDGYKSPEGDYQIRL